MNTEQIVQDEVENFVINSQWLLLDDPLRHAIREAIKREREACAKVVENKWEAFEELKAAHYRQTSEPFDPFRYHKDLESIFMSRDLAAAIRARGNE